jgi:hypothetical protein
MAIASPLVFTSFLASTNSAKKRFCRQILSFTPTLTPHCIPKFSVLPYNVCKSPNPDKTYLLHNNFTNLSRPFLNAKFMQSFSAATPFKGTVGLC